MLQGVVSVQFFRILNTRQTSPVRNLSEILNGQKPLSKLQKPTDQVTTATPYGALQGVVSTQFASHPNSYTDEEVQPLSEPPAQRGEREQPGGSSRAGLGNILETIPSELFPCLLAPQWNDIFTRSDQFVRAP